MVFRVTMDRRPLLEVYMARIGWLTANSCRKRSSGPQQSPAVASQVPFCGVLLVVVAVLLAGTAAYGQVSGKFGLDVTARRIPTTLTGEIVLDTPSEFAMLEFGIASNLHLKVGYGFADFIIDGATNMAGPEHLAFAADVRLGNLAAYGISLDGVTISPELWFAVPFEAVVDVNNLPNAVVIPPADPLFVTLRLTGTWSYAGWSVKELLMFQDVNFPNPSYSFGPLYYPVQSQSCKWGSLTYVTWRPGVATSVSTVLGLSASQAPTSVKGYSQAGSVKPGNLFLTVAVSGLSLGNVDFGTFTLQDVQIGMSGTFTPTQTPSASIHFSGRLGEQASISTSLTLFAAEPRLGGLTLSLSFGAFQAGIALNQLAVTGLSASANTPLSLGNMTGAFSVSATGLERGLTGLAFGLTVSQGLFSAGTNAAFAQRGEKFGFASLGTQLAFRFSPGVISIQATFGRYGLTRAGISTGVNF